jgi:hypothetical protein
VVRPVAARRTRPTITHAAAHVVASAASVVLSPSMVGLINSATPGIVKTLSNRGLSVGINYLTSPARIFRCSCDSWPMRPLTLSICPLASCNFGMAA